WSETGDLRLVDSALALAVLRLLQLEPLLRRAADIGRFRILPDQPLIALVNGLRPGLEPVARESPDGPETLLARDQLLQHAPPLPERLRAPVLPVELEHVEQHVDGQGRAPVLRPRAQPLVARDMG